MKVKVQELLSTLNSTQVELVLNFVKDIVATKGHNLPLDVIREIDAEINAMHKEATKSVEEKQEVTKEEKREVSLVVYDEEYYFTQHNGLYIKVSDFESLEGNLSKTIHLFTKNDEGGYDAIQYYDVIKKSAYNVQFSERNFISPPTNATLETKAQD